MVRCMLCLYGNVDVSGEFGVVLYMLGLIVLVY